MYVSSILSVKYKIISDTILENIKQPLIVTPNVKEMSRLLSCNVSDLQNDKITYLENFIKRYPVVCVLKDARTLVGSEKEDIFLNLTGNCAMAKAGSGDVLAGMIAGILAQNVDAYQAACLGVYLHGMAGDCARNKKGQYSVLAGELAEFTSDILKQI